MLINKNLVHQVGDQTKVILRCTVNQESRLDIKFHENPYVGSDLFHTDLKNKSVFFRRRNRKKDYIAINFQETYF